MGEPQEHFHTVILTSKKDGEDTYGGSALIDLEIEDRPVLGDPTKIWVEIRPECALERCSSERLHVILNRSDLGRSPVERFVGRVTEFLIGVEEMIENQRQIAITGNRSKNAKVQGRDASRR